jgi:glycosyltransferase involved in cell wall biosynthesis
MLCGTPSIASNLPGVRQPPRMTGMGDVVPIGDADSLAKAIIRIIQNPADYARPRRQIEETFSLERTVKGYETLFEALVRGTEQQNQPVQELEHESG